MGYGVPAALTAKLLHPERDVIAFAGDGDFQMCGQELATAVQEGLAIIVIVVNNGTYGTIRMHQERRFPGARDRHRPRQPRLRRRWRAPTARTASGSSTPRRSPRRCSARGAAAARP